MRDDAGVYAEKVQGHLPNYIRVRSIYRDGAWLLQATPSVYVTRALKLDEDVRVAASEIEHNLNVLNKLFGDEDGKWVD